MGRRGPAPKPSVIEELQGRPGRRPVNKREPKPSRPAAQPQAPRYLSEAARAEWRRVVRELHKTGVLTQVDTAVLEAYCVSYAHWQEAEAMLREQSAVLVSDKGNLYYNPWAGEARTAMRDMLRFAQELGMTPSARSRITVGTKEEEPSLGDQLAAAVGWGQAGAGG